MLKQIARLVMTATMTFRNAALVFLPILLICLAIVPNVQANSGITSITDLHYPSQATFQNGVAQVTVTFTVYYSDYWNPQGSLLFGVWSIADASYVKGSASTTPYSCQSLAGTKYAGDAVCRGYPGWNLGDTIC